MPNDFLKDEEAIKGYKRNLQLINLDYIPEKYENAILEQYENKPKHKTKMQILDYFIRMNLRDLPKFIEDF